ncbi:basement membrane-specific heparan sulfate proteoglycan core protein isoform X3 [Hyla sarda]|uniref:basement membrane-specific heparan sulfate proteoglycan core protein isoform X3 n=1 Tax=Hyla sarda TaxID=327740 RepID=UPI0024C3F9EE|nr:basement membrane-specific heparan sulfate proteoglycan core protein isoform X3 [Hyla sarda]
MGRWDVWSPGRRVLALLLFIQISHCSRVLDEVYFPENEAETRPGSHRWGYGDLGDDEDFMADEASGDDRGSSEIGSGLPETEGFPTVSTSTITSFSTGSVVTPLAPQLARMSVSELDQEPFLIYYRALVNFTTSIEYTPDLDNVSSDQFRDLSEAIVDTLESEYYKIPGEQMVNVVYVKVIEGFVFVEMDVGSEGNTNDAQIRQVLYSVIASGSIANYVTSPEGFQFRRLGAVTPSLRVCLSNEFTCKNGECILLEYRCDQRHDCRDMSDEEGCVEPVTCGDDEFACASGDCIPRVYYCDGRPDCPDSSDENACDAPGPVITSPTVTRRPVITPRPPTTPSPPIYTRPQVISTTPFKRTTPKPPIDPARPCRREEARCPNGQCIPRDYLCDGERDCKDGSDEFNCGTPSPCEPNEFKCRNGRCALKLWRCDGDNDCGDGSDETNCPTKGPSDMCAPDQFVCVQSRNCIPASYQCDEEADCPDRSDEIGCSPPQVITPPEESIMATRGETVRFTCVAIGIPTPIITWRLNWGHIPTSSRVSMTSENGHGTLIIRDVKEADQGAYTCEAINAKGMVFGIPDGVLSLKPSQGLCSEGFFRVDGTSQCIPCFCFGIAKVCHQTGRYRNQIRLRFDVEDDFKGVNVSSPQGFPPLSSNQLQIDPSVEEFQLVDLSRRFLSQDSFWLLPSQFLGNKVDSYGGSLRFKVRYGLTRGQSEPVRKPDVVIIGNGQKLIYRVQSSTQPAVVNQRMVQFTEENWQHESGAAVTREDLLVTLQNVEAIMIQTVYDNKMASVGLADIVMDTTSVEYTQLGVALGVEECKCPFGYSGLSCETCSPQFERIPGGPFLGTCTGCNCNGHASSCDSENGYCINCQHNTEGPQCNKCKPGFFGDPTRGTADACRPCPCPLMDPRRRYSDTCFLDTDGQPTCDNCIEGYTGRRCERCAVGYEGDPMKPGGRCVETTAGDTGICDQRGSAVSSPNTCVCKPQVSGKLCNECKSGTFYLSDKNPEGCLKCFCMGVTRECSSSYWNRDQVHATYDSHERAPFSISAAASSSRTFSEGISVTGPSELTFSAFNSIPPDVYFWVLPERFKGDKVTSYGGDLRYTITYEAHPGAPTLDTQPHVVLQGNGIFLEHSANIQTPPGFPITITVPFRESSWRRTDGQDATREHLLMALADIDVLMIRASYAERMIESRISNIHMDIAVPHSTGLPPAVEVEKCACPVGYTGPSCQDCDIGYTRSTSGLYLGTCELCRCGGHSTECDGETGECLNCQHNTEGSKCERCKPGFYGDPRRGSPGDCQPCPCQGTSSQYYGTCFLDSDGQPTCDSCPAGYVGRQCERCAPGYRGDPTRGQPCTAGSGPGPSTGCQCDLRGSISNTCDSRRQCPCKSHVEGLSCSTCRPNHFYLNADNPDGCLPCFCMGVTQQCSSSTYHRELITSPFLPGNFQNFALVNRQHSVRITTGFVVEMSTQGPQLSYRQFDQLGQESFYWQLPENYQGDKVTSYGGTLRYTLTYTSGIRGSPLPDADVQITGNDITLVAYQTELRPRESKTFEIAFRESQWKRPDGQQATREHLMMALADLDEILIRASYSTDMISAGITAVSMETAGPSYTSLPQALEVEECRCPPGYRGLSCQDCAPGYTRTGGGLYLGHCEPCDCNGHSETCHPESGVCSNCLHNTAGDFCGKCAPGFYGDATAGTPEDCQPCACPLSDPENQFSKTCDTDGAGGYRCTACPLGYTGQYCERCAPGYTGNPSIRGQKCVPEDRRSNFIVRIQPEKKTVAAGGEASLRCQGSGDPPYYYFWSREDGRPIPATTQLRDRGEILHFPSLQTSDSGVYICTCRNYQYVNTSRAEIIVQGISIRPISVTVEEQRVQRVRQGSDVTFICTAKSTSPAYTLVWTRQNNGNLPERAMDFNGILTIRNAQPEDAGIYICTGSNMFDMDEGNATLHVQEASHTQMYYGPFETMEGHRPSGAGLPPVAVIEPRQLSVQQGQPAEFHCTATGNPTPVVEWTGGPNGGMSSRASIYGGVLRFSSTQLSDEGQYTCRVHNTFGQHIARADLRIHSGNLPDVQVSPERTEVREGDTARLYCRALGSPTPTISWKKQDGILPPQALTSLGFLHFRSSSLEAIQRRIQELQAREERRDIATLLIPSITTADAGTYLCVGTNSAGSSQRQIEVIVVKASPAAPLLRIEPSSDTVLEGQSVELNCIVAAYPQATVTWHRPDRPLSPNHQVYGSRLRILQASSDDSGEYICRVTNGAGTQQASIVITINRIPISSENVPSLRIESSSGSLVEGQTLELDCQVAGYAGAEVTWYRPGIPLSPNHQVIGSRLRILQASVADSGEYICRVTSGTTTQQASTFVTVTRISGDPSGLAPTLRIEPSSNTVAEGQTLELNCVVSGPQQALVTWHRKGQPLSPNHQVLGSRLRILQASVADSGEYICRVLSGTVTRQATITVTISHAIGPVHTGITPTIRVESPTNALSEGQTVVLNCVVEGQAYQEVSWYRQGQPLSNNHQVSGSRLRILNASPRDSGEYICQVSGTSGIQAASITVSIEGSRHNTGDSGAIRIEPSSQTVEEGQNLDLSCLIEGISGHSVTWHRSSGRPLSPNHQVAGPRMRINKATVSDSGEFICRVNTGSGIQEAVIMVIVQRSSQVPANFPTPIVIEKSPGPVSEGQTVDLNCAVIGNPDAAVTWMRPAASFSSNHQIYGSRLRIVQASSADSGEYVCRYSTPSGILKASIIIHVNPGAQKVYRLDTPVISINPPSATVRQGENATFKCHVHKGAQPVRITWKMGQNQPLQDNVYISSNGSILTVVGAHHKNQGSYRCMASNAYGAVDSAVTLVVEGRPTVSVIPQGPVKVNVGETIYVECSGMGDPRPVVSWRRTGSRQIIQQQQHAPLDSHAVLQIPSAKPDDSGSYTCVGHNPAGSTQVHVDVIVEGRTSKPSAPVAIAEQSVHVTLAGETATLRCSAAGNPTPTITWSKLRAPLPWQHQIVNNSLVIPRVAQQDSGQYICNASNTDGYSEVFITLDVENPPYATTLPDELSLSVGEPIRLQCLAHGTPPLKFQWTKVNGSLTSSAEVRDGVLHISQAATTDAGTYRCVVSNKVGENEALTQISVIAPFSVRVSPQIDTKAVSDTAEFTCTVIGDPRARLQWIKEGGELPANHKVDNTVLRISNLERGNEGVYTCRALSRFGQAQDSVKLVVQVLPKVRINIRTSVQTVLAGNSVEFECLAIGDPQAKVTWSKVGSRLPSDAIINGGMLKIDQVKQSDAGQYRCTATNDVGEVQSHVILHVQSVPQIAAQPEMKEITTGSTAVFPCLASGFPVPEITWTKLEGDLPSDARIENNVLTILSVKPEDAGTYVCTAANRQGRVTAFSMLKVRERVVPYFTGHAQSYLTLPSMKDAHKKFEIKITFRPDYADGMLVYSGQKKSKGADFMSFGLVGGRPEFRFDAGSGMATIRYPIPISLGEFHTVTLYRNLNQGSLVVDNQTPVNGTSQGKFQGLDLNEELYLGGYPNFEALSKTDLKRGFVGCVRQLVIQGEEVIFKDLDLKAKDISNCPTCRDRPCKNRGICRDSESSSYVCDCPPGFAGSNCEHSQALHCHPGACGHEGTCINRADGTGYTCRCHLGQSGEKCMDGVMVNTPSFNGETSYISYPALTIIHNDLKVDLEFKPLAPNGLIFFSGGKGAPVEDFVSLTMAGGHLEFRYELGSGLAILRSADPVTLGQWHKASAERIHKDGTLQIDNAPPVKRSSPGKSLGLNLKTLMYLGGVDGSVTLPDAVNFTQPYQGCIGEVSINGKKVDISYSFIENHSISQCYDSSPCDRMPCLHGGRCMPTGEYEYQCLCRNGFKGDRCESHEDQCRVHNPCINGGTCKENKCHCPEGFSGTYCERDAPGVYGSSFSGDSYIVLPRQTFPRSRPDSPESIELELRTTSTDGVILWQGMEGLWLEHALLDTNQEEKEQGRERDFISLGLRGGHLLFSYQLGSGEANIMTEDPINDGEWHKITAIREGKAGSVHIDGEEVITGSAPGKNIMVDTKSKVYLGGAPNVKLMTGGKFSAGITGCIKNLVLVNARPSHQLHQPIDLKHQSETAHHTRECPS